MIFALILGFAFGFISAIPVAGPVSAAIFSRGMRGKYAQGRWIAFGAALVEGAYTFLAFWSFSHFLADLHFVFLLSKITSSLILGGLGIYFFTSKKLRVPAIQSGEESAKDQRAFLLGAGMSLINPTLIATWTAAITTLYSMNLFQFSTASGALFAGGVTAGITLWFAVMLKLMAKNLNRLNPHVLDKGLKGMGLFLLVLAVWMAVRIFTT